MKNFLFLTIILSLTASLRTEQDCFSLIKKLAEKDKCLASRIDTKKNAALASNEKNEFFLKVISSKCNGTAYACGKTMSWVSEVFEGLANQYDESKLDNYFDGSSIGYYYLVGDELNNLFKLNKNQPYPIIYRLRFTGNEDHVKLNKKNFFK